MLLVSEHSSRALLENEYDDEDDFRMMKRKWLVLLVVMTFSLSLTAAELERYVAVDNVCAWPNLTLLKDGTIVAAIFNHPSHGLAEGDVECWASIDGGRIWKLRGVPAPHEPGTNRMSLRSSRSLSRELS